MAAGRAAGDDATVSPGTPRAEADGEPTPAPEIEAKSVVLSLDPEVAGRADYGPSTPEQLTPAAR